MPVVAAPSRPALASPPAVRRRPWAWIVAAIVLVVVVLAGVLVGQVFVAPGTVGQIVVSHLFGVPSAGTVVAEQIVWDVRVPRVLAGIVGGAAPAVTGVVIQAVVRNPLGDPYVIGVTPGASLGAVMAIVLGTGIGSLGIAAAASRKSGISPSGRCPPMPARPSPSPRHTPVAASAGTPSPRSASSNPSTAP